ncbi:hypothetical protein ONZ45_g15711 [Pleurotus djamor]|nr:hypothetical protein ONZ45_g15711 [Pleurotus djamor]
MADLPPFEGLLPSRINLAIQNLPYLTLDDLKEASKDCCPICFVPFATILAGADDQSPAIANDPDDEAEVALNEKVPNEKAVHETESEVGVTRLGQCGHMFCRKDLAQWMRRQKGSCPTCRDVFLDLHPHQFRHSYDARPVRITRRWSRSRLWFNDTPIGIEVEVDRSQDDSDSDMDDELLWGPITWDVNMDEDDLWAPLSSIEDGDEDYEGGEDYDEGEDYDAEEHIEDAEAFREALNNPTDDHWVDAEDARSREAVRHSTTSPIRSSPLRLSWLPS